MKRAAQRCRQLLVAAGVAWLLASCSADTSHVDVRVITALVAGPEFRLIQTEVLQRGEPGAPLRVLDANEAVARVNSDYSDGRGVASFDLANGTYLLRVRLLRPSGALLVERLVSATIAADAVVSVHITRDCVGVTCPEPGGSLAFTSCLAGRCVDPRCSQESAEFCPTLAFCHEANECSNVSDCAERRCVDGLCIPETRETSCTDLEWCNPDVGRGCTKFDEASSGAIECGTICVDPGNACVFGYWNCDDRSAPACVDLGGRPVGHVCAAGRVCDELAHCVVGGGGTPGIVVVPAADRTTSEGGASTTVSVSLATAPTSDVTIAVHSSNVGEGLLAPASVRFTPDNWNSAQLVVATGVDDAVVDGDAHYFAQFDPATSDDSNYSGLDADDVELINIDDETPGVTASPTMGLTTSEAGGSATFDVTLHTAPAAEVTISFASDTPSEALVSPATLTFTSADFNTPHTVTVTGVDDAVRDGDRAFVVVTSATTSDDAAYDSLDVVDVTGVNTDDETARIVVVPTAGVVTTEGGASGTVMVSLQTQPSADVTVPVSSSDAGEGVVSPTSLTFNSVNWNTPQTVTVTGVDDLIADGTQAYEIQTGPSVSTDAFYSELSGTPAMASNADDETPGVVVSPTSGLDISENSGDATVEFRLQAAPVSDVVLFLDIDRPDRAFVTPNSITFTPTDYDSWHPVLVIATNNFVRDGDQSFTLQVSDTLSGDATYTGLPVDDVSGVIRDDEVAGFDVFPASGLSTGEDGTTDAFLVVLLSQPSAAVSVSLASSNATEGTVNPTSLTFLPSDWNVAQTVTVSGVDDAVVDGDQDYTVTFGAATSSDAFYSGTTRAALDVTNADNDVASIVVSPTTGLSTSEAGATDTFTVVLGAPPTASVSMPLATSDATEGTVLPAMLTFTVMNWNVPQTVTVTGVNDPDVDGDRAFSVVIGDTVSSSDGYNGIDVDDVDVVNVDNDVVGVVVTPTSGLTTSEAGATASFTVVLESAPSANVSVSLESSDATEGSVSPSALTFTNLNWSTPQTVVVTGANDGLSDGAVAYTVVTGAAASPDSNYNGLHVDDVGVTNTDDDPPAFTREAYVKASNTGNGDFFGWSIALSADGNTMAVGSQAEASNAMGVNGDQADNSAFQAGAVYVFTRSGSSWMQQAYIKSSNTGAGDLFGTTMSISADGNTLAVGASSEDSNATGIGGDGTNNAASGAGAVYVFTRSSGTWSQQAYVKASNTGASDGFGYSVALAADGDTLAVGANAEASNATGIGGDQSNNAAGSAGAAYVFTRVGMVWSQQAYVKATNTGASDFFGFSVALSGTGDTLAVGAILEASNATGVGGDQSNNAASQAGAVYVYARAAGVWSPQAYLKASNTESGDWFGRTLAMSTDGSTLAVAAYSEDSASGGVGGNQSDNAAPNSGAVYVFTQSAGVWSQQAYVKHPAPMGGDDFGVSLALSGNGDALVVGAWLDDSSAVGIDGSTTFDGSSNTGSVTTYIRSGTTWYVNSFLRTATTLDSTLGTSVAVTADGSTVVAGARYENSNATGVGGDETSSAGDDSGAVYVFRR